MSDSVTALAVTSNFAVESVVGVCAQTIYYHRVGRLYK